MRSFLKFLVISLVVAVLGVGVVIGDYMAWKRAPVHQGSDDHYLEVAQGSSFRTLLATLEDEGLIEKQRYFEFLARYRGDAGRIRAGEYWVPANMTPPELLDRLVSGRVIQYSFTIVEGWNFSQLRAALEADPRVPSTLSELEDGEVMARLSGSQQHPEGWFYPETYRFTRGVTDEDILRWAYQAMEKQLAEAWENRAADLPIETPYQALILASIIERETGKPSERGEIAGVFSRRLEQGMRLQTDPTVIYGMGDNYQGRIRTRDLRSDTPYNTYTRHGLPPTPIALPGGASLRAAVNPEPGETLYFVSRGDGSHHFSVTYEEHRSAVRRYILGEVD